jgi:hypothetical protein
MEETWPVIQWSASRPHLGNAGYIGPLPWAIFKAMESWPPSTSSEPVNGWSSFACLWEGSHLRSLWEGSHLGCVWDGSYLGSVWEGSYLGCVWVGSYLRPCVWRDPSQECVGGVLSWMCVGGVLSRAMCRKGPISGVCGRGPWEESYIGCVWEESYIGSVWAGFLGVVPPQEWEISRSLAIRGTFNPSFLGLKATWNWFHFWLRP